MSNQPPFETSLTPQAPATAPGMTGLWLGFLAVWGLLALGGALVAKLTGNWAWVVVLMAPMTLVGVAWRPLFGLALMCALMPVGEALGYKHEFSAERGMGVLFAVGTGLHLLVTHGKLRLFCLPVLTLFGMGFLGLLSVLWASYAEVTLVYALTLAQLFVYVLIVLSLCRDEADLKWPLRIFVIACILALVIPRLAGIDMATKAERLTVAFGEEEMNPNSFGVMLGLGFLAAIYLLRRDRSWLFRAVYLLAFVVLPAGVLMSGSRKAILAVAVGAVLPLVLSTWLIRRPRLLAIVLVLTVFAGVSLTYTLEHLLPKETEERLMSRDYAVQSYNVRASFIQDALTYVYSHPLGAGLANFRTRISQQVHNDFFYILADLGFAGALLFAVWNLSLVFAVWRMRGGPDKWFASALVLFFILIGLGGTWIFAKYYWLFLSIAWFLAKGVRPKGDEQAPWPYALDPELVQPTSPVPRRRGLPSPPRNG